MKKAVALVVCTWLGCGSSQSSDVEVAKAEPVEAASVVEVEPPPPASAAPFPSSTTDVYMVAAMGSGTLEDVLRSSDAPPTKGSSAVNSGSVANASAVVAGMAAGFRRCFNEGRKTDPNMQGTVRITAKIGPNGDVVGTTASGGAGLSDPVIACVAARVSSAAFSPPEGGKGATIVIPVSFSP